jgi:signal transduction histidine kinase
MKEKSKKDMQEIMHLKERVNKLALEKSYLQLMTDLMNRLSSVSGLDNTIETMLSIVMDAVGGSNIAIYYIIDDEYYYADVFGKKMKVINIDDVHVQKVIETLEEIETISDFSNTKMTTPEFTDAFTWTLPLLVGTEIVGVLKIENFVIAKRDVKKHLKVFLNYASFILKNEILGYSKILAANEKLKNKNKELEHANKRLFEMDQLKSIFLASMSHELRTPLNSIIGYTGILLMGMAGELNEEQSKQLSKVKNNGKHLLALINDILDISKVEAGKVELLVEPFKLNTVVYDVIESVRPLIIEKNIELSYDIPEGIELQTDERRFKQVLMNLASNAVKFTQEGTITLKAELIKNKRIKISMSDTGMGMSKEDTDRLFQPFQQIDSSLTKEYEGTGLGLYLCRKLMDLMQGSISVESEVNKGSEFSIILPLIYKGESK